MRFGESLAWLFSLSFALTYALWPWLGLPTPLYAPETGQILWRDADGVITMGWYGRFLGSAVVGVALTLLLAPLTRFLPEENGRYLAWATAIAVLAAMVVISCTEWTHWIAGR